MVSITSVNVSNTEKSSLHVVLSDAIIPHVEVGLFSFTQLYKNTETAGCGYFIP